MAIETRLKKGSRFTKAEIKRIRKEGKILAHEAFTSGNVVYDQISVKVPDTSPKGILEEDVKDDAGVVH